MKVELSKLISRIGHPRPDAIEQLSLRVAQLLRREVRHEPRRRMTFRRRQIRQR